MVTNPNGVTDWTRASYEDCRQTLRTWRDENARRSEECVEIWEHVLSRYPGGLGDELWLVYEQVAVAGLDCGRYDISQECISALHTQFPNSSRVWKLEAMRFEAVGRYDDAVQLYDRLISKEETNPIYRKRKIAVLKAQGLISESIKELTEYLKTFMNDTEAWTELCQLYLEEHDFTKASFCFEELLLTNPYNHLYHTRYAEIKYTQCGMENVELAKSYFCQAVKLNPKNVRALYGIFLSCSHLVILGKASGQRKKELLKLADWAAETLLEFYRANEDTGANMGLKIMALEGMIKNLQLGLGAETSSA